MDLNILLAKDFDYYNIPENKLVIINNNFKRFSNELFSIKEI